MGSMSDLLWDMEIEILHATQQHFEAGWSHASDSNRFYRLWYIQFGSITVSLNGKAYYGSPGDFLFLPAAERIVIGNPGPHPLRYLTVLFRIHHKFGLHPLDFLELPIIRRASADNCLYADKLTEMAGEYAARRFARQLVAKAHLLQLLVYEIRRRPDIEAALSSGDVAGPLGKAFPLESLLHFIIQQPDHQPATAELARLLKVSETHLRRLFKQHVGMTPHAFVQQIKIRQSQTDLAHTMLNVSEIAMKYGFDSGNRFAKVFRQWTGCTPTEYRRTVNVQSNN